MLRFDHKPVKIAVPFGPSLMQIPLLYSAHRWWNIRSRPLPVHPSTSWMPNDPIIAYWFVWPNPDRDSGQNAQTSIEVITSTIPSASNLARGGEIIIALLAPSALIRRQRVPPPARIDQSTSSASPLWTDKVSLRLGKSEFSLRHQKLRNIQRQPESILIFLMMMVMMNMMMTFLISVETTVAKWKRSFWNIFFKLSYKMLIKFVLFTKHTKATTQYIRFLNYDDDDDDVIFDLKRGICSRWKQLFFNYIYKTVWWDAGLVFLV